MAIVQPITEEWSGSGLNFCFNHPTRTATGMVTQPYGLSPQVGSKLDHKNAEPHRLVTGDHITLTCDECAERWERGEWQWFINGPAGMGRFRALPPEE